MTDWQQEIFHMTLPQEQAVRSLNAQQLRQIDQTILQNVTCNWRKVAMVVALSMNGNELHVEGVPDIYYAKRLGMLAADGKLEITGDALEIRRTEVRLPMKA